MSDTNEKRSIFKDIKLFFIFSIASLLKFVGIGKATSIVIESYYNILEKINKMKESTDKSLETNVNNLKRKLEVAIENGDEKEINRILSILREYKNKNYVIEKEMENLYMEKRKIAEVTKEYINKNEENPEIPKIEEKDIVDDVVSEKISNKEDNDGFISL